MHTVSSSYSMCYGNAHFSEDQRSRGETDRHGPIRYFEISSVLDHFI